MKIESIKNETFKKYSIDDETNKLISSMYLISFDNLKQKSRLVWSYYRDRGKINANNIINKYGKNTLIINYSIETHK
jgi:hypothetical protein